MGNPRYSVYEVYQSRHLCPTGRVWLEHLANSWEKKKKTIIFVILNHFIILRDVIWIRILIVIIYIQYWKQTTH